MTAHSTAARIPPIDVRDYGAVFDNSTDDTTAIQNALNAAVTAVTGVSAGNDYAGRTVQLPPGRSRILGTLTVPANVKLVGHGASATYLYKPSSGSTTGAVVAVSGVQQSLENFGIISDNTAADCLDLSGNSGASILGDGRTVVSNVVVVGGHDGVVSTSGGNGNELRLNNVTSQRAGRRGFWLSSTDAFLYGCTAGATAGDYGFLIQGANTRVFGCKAYGGAAHGFGIGGAGRHPVSCCEAQDCANDGFQEFGNDPSVLTGCEVDSCGTFAFRLVSGTLNGGVAINRGGGVYTIHAALKRDGTTNVVRGLRVGSGIVRLAKDNGASAADYATGMIDIDGRFGPQAIAYAASITPDPWLGQDAIVGTLTGNISIANPNSPAVSPVELFFPYGMTLRFYLTQDATGGRTVTFDTNFATSGAIDTTASSTTVITFSWTGSKWREIGRVKT